METGRLLPEKYHLYPLDVEIIFINYSKMWF